MSDARERLTRLIELARENVPEKQPALAFELCDLLVDWPARYPKIMREPFEALLEKVLRRIDGTTRRLIATRLVEQSETALTVLNEFYLDVAAEPRRRILARNAELGASTPPQTDRLDEHILIAAARDGRDVVGALARVLRVPRPAAQAIWDDESGDALAVACRGGDFRRATYSALTLLGATKTDIDVLYTRLSLFEAIPQDGARHLLEYWRRDARSALSGARAA